MKRFWMLLLAGCASIYTSNVAVPANETSLQTGVTIVDGSGKEHNLQGSKFVAGIKHLSWLVDAPAELPKEPPPKDKIKAGGGGGGGKKGGAVPPAPSGPAIGPEALEFSEGKVAPLKKRVVSYVPLVNIRRIDFDNKDGISVRVATSDKEADDVVLYGLTGYAGVNIVAIEAVTDLGELGKGTIRFEKGKGRGLQSIRFPAPKPIEAPPAGRIATIKQVAKNQPSYTVTDLKALYNVGGGLLRASPTLYFKDTIKLDLAKVQKLSGVGASATDYDVTLMSGQQSPLVLIDRPKGADGKTDMLLDGLVGRFAGGYRVFPMSTVGEVAFEEKK